jgi:heptaprenyl diphosphate synthase
METRRITLLSILLALSIILSVVDSMISSLVIPFIGVKLGLANVVTIVIMYQFNNRDALLLAITRILLVALIRGSALQTLMMSLSGGLLAYALMYLSKQTNVFSLIGVSVSGAVGHSVGQIVMAVIWVSRIEAGYVLPYVLLLSVVTGVFTGMVSKEILRVLKTAQN